MCGVWGGFSFLQSAIYTLQQYKINSATNIHKPGDQLQVATVTTILDTCYVLLLFAEATCQYSDIYINLRRNATNKYSV
jgi:hypothetical protein